MVKAQKPHKKVDVFRSLLAFKAIARIPDIPTTQDRVGLGKSLLKHRRGMALAAMGAGSGQHSGTAQPSIAAPPDREGPSVPSDAAEASAAQHTASQTSNASRKRKQSSATPRTEAKAKQPRTAGSAAEPTTQHAPGAPEQSPGLQRTQPMPSEQTSSSHPRSGPAQTNGRRTGSGATQSTRASLDPRLGSREILEDEAGTKPQRTASGDAAGPGMQPLLPPTPPVPTVPPQDEVEPPPPVTAKGPHLHLYNAPDQPPQAPQPQARPLPSSQPMQHARPPPSKAMHQPQQQPQQRSNLPGPLPVTSRPPNMDPNIFAAAQQLAEAASAPAAAARMQGSVPSSQPPPGGALPFRGPSAGPRPSSGPRPSVSLGRGPALPLRQPPMQGKAAEKAPPPAQPRSVLQVLSQRMEAGKLQKQQSGDRQAMQAATPSGPIPTSGPALPAHRAPSPSGAGGVGPAPPQQRGPLSAPASMPHRPLGHSQDMQIPSMLRKPGAPQQLHRLSSPGYPPRPQQGYPSGGGPHPAAQAPMGYGTPGGAALRFNRPGQMPVRPPASASQEQALEQAHRQERVKWRECLQHIELNHSRDLTALQEHFSGMLEAHKKDMQRVSAKAARSVEQAATRDSKDQLERVKVMVEDLAARLPDPASGPLPDDMPEAARAHMAKLKTQVNSLTRQLKASEAQNTSLQKKLDNVIGERDASRVRLQTLEESGAAAALMDLDPQSNGKQSGSSSGSANKAAERKVAALQKDKAALKASLSKAEADTQAAWQQVFEKDRECLDKVLSAKAEVQDQIQWQTEQATAQLKQREEDLSVLLQEKEALVDRLQADLGTWQELESQGLTASEAKVMQEHTQSLDKTTSDLTTLLRDKRAQLAKAEERIEQLEHELAEAKSKA